MSEIKTNAGGARKGAGRKPLPSHEKLTRLVLYVPPYLADWFAAQEWAAAPEIQEQEREGRKADAVRLLKRMEVESRII